MSNINNIQKALNFGKSQLITNNIKDAELSAELLLAEVTNLNRQSLYGHFENKLTELQQKQYEEYISRRLINEPVQYILGYTYFRGLKIAVGPGVLVPRPETEQLVDVTKKFFSSDGIRVLDLCTGSGCISCVLANEYKDIKIVATDISQEALNYAKRNVEAYKLSDKISLVQCSLADEVDQTDFDLIISNPPYIPTKVYKRLDNEVLNFEPKIALEAGADGASLLKDIIKVAKNKLNPHGVVALEFHEENLELAKFEFENAGFNKCQIFKDLAQKDRILIAKN